MRLLTYKQLAEIIGVKEQTLRKWFCKRQDVPCIKFTKTCVRFEENTIMNYLKDTFGVNLERGCEK